MLETPFRVQMRVTEEENYKIQKMKSRQVLLGLLCSILVLGLVNCGDWQEKSFFAPPPPPATWKEEAAVVVTNADKTFYRAKIESKSYQLRVSIIDSAGITKTLDISVGSGKFLVFVGAVQNYILVKQVASDKTTILNYWVFIIVYNPAASGSNKYSLDKFSVNPFVDTNFKKFMKLQITKILQLDASGRWIAVLAFNDDKEVFVFKINIKEKLNALIAFSWFELCGQKIIGGNSRVLYDRTANVFLINQQSCSSPYSATRFKKLQVCQLTKKPLDSTDVVTIVNLEGAFFQFFALSVNKKNALTFLFRGYGEKSIKGLVSLSSSEQIVTITDNFNFFLAFTNKDIYLSNVFIKNGDYYYFAGLMSSVVAEGDRTTVYNIWRNLKAIVFAKEKFFLISGNKFYVFGSLSKSFRKVADYTITGSYTDAYEKLFQLIDQYNY